MEIYVKIYTKDNNNILCFEGIEEKKEDYYFAQGRLWSYWKRTYFNY